MPWRTSEPLPESRTTRRGRDTRPRSHEGELRRGSSSRSKNGEGLQSFTEFLQETPPPVYNIMSIPDNFSIASEDGSWTKLFRTIRRRRRKGRRRHQPPIIKLPDSAVAGTTIGGHRHIAISIPIEHSYLRSTAQSQLPISESIDAEAIYAGAAQGIDPQQSLQPRFAPPQSRSAERGITNFLQSVAEDRESPPVPVSPDSQPGPTQFATARKSHHTRDSAYSLSGGPSPTRRSSLARTTPNALTSESTQPTIEEATIPEASTRRKPQPIVVVPDMTPALSSQTRRSVPRRPQEVRSELT